MVHLSKYPVDEKKLIKTFRLMFELMSNTDNQDDFLQLIKDILSPPEQIMVAKRMAIIYLLNKGVDRGSIVEYLKVTKSTVAKFSLLFYEKETELIILIRKLLKNEKFLHFFEDLFTDLTTHQGFYIGHWQKYWDHKRRQEERKMIDK